MPSFKMNGHPDPVADESARGYLLRMVDVNGYKNVENICRKAGTKFAHKIHVMSQQWEQILGVFTPVLYKEESLLIETFEQHWTAKLYAKFDMKLSNLFSVNCRVCPMCIKGENGYANADWDFALSTVCTKHKCHLIEACPHCGEPISWKRGKLDTCRMCDENYSSAPAKVLEKDNPLLKLNKHYSTMGRDGVEQFILACSRMYRPQDNIFACPSLRLMSLDEINSLLNQALGLMHSSNFRAQYQRWLDETRSKFAIISNNAVQEPLNAFMDSYSGKLDNRLAAMTFIPPIDSRNTLNKDEIIKVTHQSEVLGIKTARLKNITDDIDEIYLSSQIDSKRLASILGVPFYSIQHLVNSGVLNPLNNVATARHYLFDLYDMATLLSNVSVQEPRKGKTLIPLSSLAGGKLLSMFAMQLHHVVEVILQQKVRVYFDKKKEGFFNGSVCENELINALEKITPNNHKRLNINELSKRLNTTPQCIIKLSLLGLIKVNTTYTKNDLFTKLVTEESLNHFLCEYLSLNRESYFSDVRIDKLLRLLKDKGIEPTLTVNDGKASLYLIKKSTKLTQAISSLIQ